MIHTISSAFSALKKKLLIIEYRGLVMGTMGDFMCVDVSYRS